MVQTQPKMLIQQRLALMIKVETKVQRLFRSNTIHQKQPPSSGFDTTGINFAFPEEIEIFGDDLQAEETDTFINSLPSTGENIPIAFDDDTLGGNPGGINDDDPNNLNLTGVLSHNFGNDGPGTVLLSNTGAPAGFIYTLNDDGTVMTVSQDGTDVLQVSLNDTMSGEYPVTPLHN